MLRRRVRRQDEHAAVDEAVELEPSEESLPPQSDPETCSETLLADSSTDWAGGKNWEEGPHLPQNGLV